MRSSGSLARGERLSARFGSPKLLFQSSFHSAICHDEWVAWRVLVVTKTKR